MHQLAFYFTKNITISVSIGPKVDNRPVKVKFAIKLGNYVASDDRFC